MRKLLTIILYSAVILLAICSILSVFRDTDSRYLKMLDFPRIQFFILSLFGLGIFALITKRRHRYDFAIIVGLLIGLFVNGFFLADYTGLVPAEMPSSKNLKSGDSSISLLITGYEAQWCENVG